MSQVPAEMAAPPRFAKLPLCLLTHAFSYLTLVELNVAAAVSRRWLEIAVAEATRPGRREELERTYAEQCRKGGVGWLRMLEADGIDACEAFIAACDSGNVAVAKWLSVGNMPNYEWTCLGVIAAARRGRGSMAILRWLKRTYISTPQEIRKVRNSVARTCCDRKTWRWLGEQLGRRFKVLCSQPHEPSARLELARWHADHSAGHWDIAHEITGGHPVTAQWLVRQFGLPPLTGRAIGLAVAKLLLEVYGVSLAAGQIQPIEALEPFEACRWFVRRYGPATAPVIRITDRRQQSHTSARWIVERTAGAPCGSAALCEPARRYIADTYGQPLAPDTFFLASRTERRKTQATRWS